MSEYIVRRTVTFIFKVEAVNQADALDHAQENIDDIEDATSINVFEEWEVEECSPYDRSPTEDESAQACYEEMMIEQSKRDRRLWEASELGKQYALARNQDLMENNCTELGFEEISRLISEKSKMFGLEVKCHKAMELIK